MLQFPGHYLALREIDGLSDSAFRLHMSALFWADVNGTAGLIPVADLKLVAGRLRNPARLAAECVRRGTWHEAGQDCGSVDCPAALDATDGWVVHDFRLLLPGNGRQDPASGKSSAGRYGNHRRWHEQRGVTDPACPFCTRDGTPSSSESHSDRTTESHSDETSDRAATPNRSDQIDHQSSVLALVHQSDACDDIAPDQVSDELAAAAATAIGERTGQPAADDVAREVTARILNRARHAGKHVRTPARYVTSAIAREPDLYGGLLAGSLPPLGEILGGFRRDREPGPGRHGYQPGQNDRCAACGFPEPNQRHQEARTA